MVPVGNMDILIFSLIFGIVVSILSFFWEIGLKPLFFINSFVYLRKRKKDGITKQRNQATEP